MLKINAKAEGRGYNNGSYDGMSRYGGYADGFLYKVWEGIEGWG